jgi:hypothetical protein
MLRILRVAALAFTFITLISHQSNAEDWPSASRRNYGSLAVGDERWLDTTTLQRTVM